MKTTIVAEDIANYAIYQLKNRVIQIREIIKDSALHILNEKEIENPGLAILAAIATSKTTEPVVLTSRPVSQVFRGQFDYDHPVEPQHILPYDWVVVEYWARWLREKRTLIYATHDARGDGLPPI